MKKPDHIKTLEKYGTHLCTLAFYLYTNAKLSAWELAKLHEFQAHELSAMANAFSKTLTK
jgi:hypothetical protein